MGVSHTQDELEVPGDYSIPYFDILKDAFDPSTVPFTERGSRILIGLSPVSSSSQLTSTDGESLNVRMAERWLHLEKKLGNHRVRRPLIEHLRPIDRSGNPLSFKLSAWPHKLLLRTSVGDYEVLFADKETLYIHLPDTQCGLSFSVMADSFLPDERGGAVDLPRRLVMTCDNATTGLRVVGASQGTLSMTFEAQVGGQHVLAINIPQSSECTRVLRPAAAVLGQAQQTWKAWFDAAPRVDRKYWRPYYLAWMILRTGLLSSSGYLKREALAPSKTHYLGVWHWDAYFHALAYRHVDPGLAQDQLLALLDHQLDNGMIPDVVHDEGIIAREDGAEGRELTKPPLIAWAALKIFETGGGSRFLRDTYEQLVRWNNWWLERCDDDRDGIAQYNHPCSSGLDDSPLWDTGMPVESPDLSSYICVQMQSLATIARVTGRYRDAELWDRKARDLARLATAHFYDNSCGLFWATRNHIPIRVLTPLSLLPIWTGCLSASQVRALVSNLTRDASLWTEFGIPTVSRNDLTYDPDRMWRGPVWVNVNYMMIEALSRVGYHNLAATLADRTIDLVARQGAAEYFNSITGDVPPRAAPAFGWSAALFIDLLIRRSRERRSSRGSSTYANGFASY